MTPFGDTTYDISGEELLYPHKPPLLNSKNFYGGGVQRTLIIVKLQLDLIHSTYPVDHKRYRIVRVFELFHRLTCSGGKKLFVVGLFVR